MSLHLTSEEVNDLCAPLKQRAAQCRFIEKVLGLPISGTRPDGLPLVGRTIADEILNQRRTNTATVRGFNWSK